MPTPCPPISHPRKHHHLTHLYQTTHRLLLTTLTDTTHHFRHTQRTLTHELQTLFHSSHHKKPSPVESLDNTEPTAAAMQHIPMPSPTPRIPIPRGADENRNSTLDFLANYGSALPPARDQKRMSVLSPLAGGATAERLVVGREEMCELDAAAANAVFLSGADDGYSGGSDGDDARAGVRQHPRCLQIGVALPDEGRVGGGWLGDGRGGGYGGF